MSGCSLIDPASSARSLLANAWRDAVDRGEIKLPRFYNLRERLECAALASAGLPPYTLSTDFAQHAVAEIHLPR
jgi:hypothetical protein